MAKREGLTDIPVMPWWVKGYDAKLLKRLEKDLEFMKFFHEFKQPSPEEKRRRKIENKWYERRVARVKKVMEAYRISASSLCNCDY